MIPGIPTNLINPKTEGVKATEAQRKVERTDAVAAPLRVSKEGAAQYKPPNYSNPDEVYNVRHQIEGLFAKIVEDIKQKVAVENVLEGYLRLSMLCARHEALSPKTPVLSYLESARKMILANYSILPEDLPSPTTSSDGLDIEL